VSVEIRRRDDGMLAVEDNGPASARYPGRPGLSAVVRNVIRHGGRMDTAEPARRCRVSLWLS
jgi:hypothetical protein